MSMILRDIVYFTTQKLQNDWTAVDFAKHLTSENLQALIPKYDRLDPMVRVRLLLSVLSLDKQKLAGVQTELKALLDLAKSDKEEWVSITARALNNFQAPLDLQAVISGSAEVAKSIQDMEAQLDTGSSAGYRPLEEAYLSPSLVDADDETQQAVLNHGHFTIKNGGANCLEDLYRKASESAAAAVNTIRPHTHHTSTRANLPTHSIGARTSRAGESQGIPGMRPAQRPSASAAPRSRPASSLPGARGVAETDMFRSSKPADLGIARPASSTHTGQHDRRPVARAGGVRLLDVQDVKKLNRPQVASPHSSGSVLNGRTRGQSKPAEASSEEEEGELEAGEFTEDAQSGPSLKRARQAEVIS